MELDAFTARYEKFLVGTYDCVDRIVLNAYFSMGHSPAGFRVWWRQLFGEDETLDDTHLMRLAGRFSRRLRAYAKDHQIPVISCESGTRKHEIAEEYLAQHPQAQGLFLVLVARAQAPIWQVKRGANGYMNLSHPKHLPFVNHYYFHILDPDWGHITIKMCGHPPFPAQIMLNGKEGNCFTQIEEGQSLALVADAWRQNDAIGRLSQVCDRWIYSACLCFALTSEEQERSGFRYAFSIYQIEYSRNLQFGVGAVMEQLFDATIDRTRKALDVKRLKTILGIKHRPHRRRKTASASREEIVIETPAYNLTVFKVHFGGLTLKGYTKGEHTLRFEAIVHNTRTLGCGRVLEKFDTIVASLQNILERFLSALRGIEAPFLSATTWDSWSTPGQVGRCRVGGLCLEKPRMRAVLAGIVAVAPAPTGFTASDLAAVVCSQTGQARSDYGPTRAAYDIKKLRGKNLVVKIGKSRRYEPTPDGLRAMAAISVLRDKVLQPLLAATVSQEVTAPSPETDVLDARYASLRAEMKHLLNDLAIAA